MFPFVPLWTVGFKVTYDKKTKETVITKGTNELRFKTDSASIP